jgi:hypothetical protein
LQACYREHYASIALSRPDTACTPLHALAIADKLCHRLLSCCATCRHTEDLQLCLHAQSAA